MDNQPKKRVVRQAPPQMRPNRGQQPQKQRNEKKRNRIFWIIGIILLAIFTFIPWLGILAWLTFLGISIYFLIKHKKKTWIIGIIGAAIMVFYTFGFTGTSSQNDASSSNSLIKKSSSSTSKSENSSKSSTEASKSTGPITSTADTVSNFVISGDNSSIGKEYEFTGDLMNSAQWNNGGDGYYVVYVNTNVDTDGMMVYTNEDTAANWTDGSKVDFTVKIKKDSVGTLLPVVVSSKILSGGTSKEAKQQALEDKFYKDLSDQVGSLNDAVGMTLIDSIDKGQVYPEVDVHLNSAASTVSTTEIKSFITSLNKSLYNTSFADSQKNPNIYYYIGDMKVAENKSILDPSQVKFNSNLN